MEHWALLELFGVVVLLKGMWAVVVEELCVMFTYSLPGYQLKSAPILDVLHHIENQRCLYNYTYKVAY